MTDAAAHRRRLSMRCDESVERLHGLVAPMDDAQLEAQAYPKEWRVADVLSHLGSSAVIGSERFRTACEVSRSPTPLRRRCGRHGTRSRRERRPTTPRRRPRPPRPASRRHRRRAVEPPFSMGPMQFDFGGLVGLRLNEHTCCTRGTSRWSTTPAAGWRRAARASSSTTSSSSGGSPGSRQSDGRASEGAHDRSGHATSR